MDPKYAFGRSPSGGSYHSPMAPGTPCSPNQSAFAHNPLFTTPPVTPIQQHWGNSAPFAPPSPGQQQQQQKITSMATIGLRPSRQNSFPATDCNSVPHHHHPFSPPVGGVALPFPPAGGVQLPFPSPQPLPCSPLAMPSPTPSIPPPPPPLPPGSGSSAPGMPPPPPPPPLSGMTAMPSWKAQQAQKKQQNAEEESLNNMPSALHGTLQNPKNKKPFTYTPGGLDLSEIRSPRMQRRLLAHQQSFGDNKETNNNNNINTTRAEVHPPPRPRPMNEGYGGEVGQSPHNEYYQQHPTGSLPRVPRTPDESFRQSQSFRLLQMMTDTGHPDQNNEVRTPPICRKEEDEMRFSGLRQSPGVIPSRAFNTLQRMTSSSPPPSENSYVADAENGNGPYGQEEGPVDIRYMGGNIPSRSFRMLQEMTGLSDEEASVAQSPPPMPTVQQPRRVVRTQMNVVPGGYQYPPPKQFPQPTVPASQQEKEADPKKYSGGRIPGQSFRILQNMTGEVDDGGTDF